MDQNLFDDPFRPAHTNTACGIQNTCTALQTCDTPLHFFLSSANRFWVWSHRLVFRLGHLQRLWAGYRGKSDISDASTSAGPEILKTSDEAARRFSHSTRHPFIKWWGRGHAYGTDKTGSLRLLCEALSTLTCTRQWAPFFFSIQPEKRNQSK